MSDPDSAGPLGGLLGPPQKWAQSPDGVVQPATPVLPPSAPVGDGFGGLLLPDSAGPAGIRFRVEPEQAEKLAAALDVAADRVEALIGRAKRLSAVQAGAADAVSQSAATRIATWPDGGDGALMPALIGYRNQLRGSAAAYRQQLADYRRNEELSAGDLSSINPEGQL